MNKAQRLVRLLLVLSKGTGVSREHCMSSFDLSESTFYDYIRELRDMGFEIQRNKDRYSLDVKGSEYKLFSQLYPLDSEDEFLLVKAIEGLNHSAKKQQNLVVKLKVLLGSDEYIDKLLPQKQGELLRIVQSSIQNKKQVFIENYASGKSLKRKEYTLEPFYVLDGLEMFWAFDVKSRKNKLFKFCRIEGLTETPFDFQYERDHTRNEVDDFDFGGVLDKFVRFELDFLARNLLVEEYPRSEKNIKEQAENLFVYEAKCVSFDGPARFVLGFAEHCRVLGDERFRQFIENKYKKNNPLREIRSEVL